MTIFILTAVLMLLLIMAILLSALWKQAGQQVKQRHEQNILIRKEQLAALDLSLASAEISEAEYQQQRTEVESSLLEEAGDDEDSNTGTGNIISPWRTALVLILFVPLFVVGGYVYLGTPEALDLQTNRQVTEHASGTHQNLPSIDEMLQRLEQRLSQQPNDINGWMMAGRSYMALKKYPQAAQAFKRAYALDKHNAAIIFRYADALAMSHNGRLSGEPFDLLQQGLQLEPNNVMGLWLSGNAFAEQQKFDKAIDSWRRARQLVASEPASVRELDMLIANAQQQVPGTGKEKTDKQPATAAAGITVSVSLAPELAKRANANDVVFILAKAMQGPPMPLAVVRKKVSDLPLTITLTEEMAMAPSMSLANFSDVVLVARVSKSGLAKSAQGDLIGQQQVHDWPHAGEQIIVIRGVLGQR